MTETTNHTKEISLIFVNYRSVFHLSRALRSLEKDPSFRSDAEAIVVNQDETERKAMRVLSEQWGCKLVEQVNYGFASGANRGASLAEGDILAFLNPDIRYATGSLREGADLFRENLHLGIVGATLLQGGAPEEWSRGRFLTFFQLIWNNIVPGVFSHGRGEIDWVSGGAFFIRKEVFQALGGFDENFFLYFEDMDLCQRAKKAGLLVLVMQSLQLFHRGGTSFSSKRVQKKHYADSQAYYFKKHRPYWEVQILSILQRLKIW